MGINGLARINHGQILDGHAARPGPIPPATGPHQRAERVALRLLPLEGFIWGGTSTPHRSRSRGDHVLIWVTRGRLALNLSRRALLLQPGDLRWIPAGTGFAAMPRRGCAGHLLLIPPPLVQDLQPAFARRWLAARLGEDPAGPRARTLLPLLRKLDLLAAQGSAGPLLLRHLGQLALMLQDMADSPVDADSAADLPAPELIARFEAMARSVPPATLTISDLAQRLGCSSAALDRACMERHGCRAVERVNEMRLERAVQMLRETTLSPVQIAADMGYASHAHFARALAGATGRRPEAFRKAPHGASRAHVSPGQPSAVQPG